MIFLIFGISFSLVSLVTLGVCLFLSNGDSWKKAVPISAVGAVVTFLSGLALFDKTRSGGFDGMFASIFAAWFCYLIFVLASKLILVWAARRKKAHKKSVKTSTTWDDEISKHPISAAFERMIWFLISPDYFVTFYYVRLLFKIEGEEKSRVIIAYNVFNLLFSFATFLICLWLFCSPCRNEGVIYFAKICAALRLFSRCLEIVASFLGDITEKRKTSGLKSGDRILLAFSSLLEVLFLSLGSFLFSSSSFISALERTLMATGGLELSSQDGFFDKFTKIAENATCTSLIGLVITSYIGGT